MRKILSLILGLLFIMNSLTFADAIDPFSGLSDDYFENEEIEGNDNYYEIDSTQDYAFNIEIEDDANLLTDEEEKRLYNEIQGCADYGNILIKTIQDNSTSTSNFAERYYHQKYGKESGSIFLIDMDNRMIYIFSEGYNYRTITKSKANVITDNVYRYASREEYYNCINKATNQIYTLLSGGKILEPMRYISNALLALVTSLLITFWYVMKKSKITVADTNDVIKNCDIKFKINNINVCENGTRSVYSPQHSSGGGGGYSGGRSGGHSSHSSGGGGGHRF